MADTPTAEEGVATDNVHIVLRGPDGEVKQEEKCHNLITTAGLAAIIERLDSSAATAAPTHMAIGTGTTAAVAGNTTLETELDRNALTSNTSSANVLTLVGDWAAGDGTGAITEAGVLNAVSTGTLYARAVFSVVTKGSSDSLSITWTWTLSAA